MRQTNGKFPGRARRFRRLVVTAAICGGLLATSLPAQAAPLALEPVTACHALADDRLGARGDYARKPGAPYRCTSQRKPLTAGGEPVHEIRYYASGDETAVREMTLELYVRSRQDIQRAHRLLTEHAARLLERTLATPLPDQVNRAILGGTVGEWSIDGRVYELRRVTLAAPTYELILTIR